MKVIRAEVMGLCFGVRDALEATERIDAPEQVTIHGELVHNEQVLVQLETRGFQITAEDNRAALPEKPNVLITAHGVSDRERLRLLAAGKQLLDTTCPLVRRVHRAAQSLHTEGRHVIVIGRPGHVEVRGIVEDLTNWDVVIDPQAVRHYPARKLGIVCQTTTPPSLASQVRSAIRDQNPRADIRTIDTICQPTRDRQQAVERLLRRVDVMIVVGGANSNNTRQLLARCLEREVPGHHIQSADEIDPSWFDGCQTIGLTAGTSTLQTTIDDVYRALCQLCIEPVPQPSR